MAELDHLRTKLIVLALATLPACDRPRPDSGSGRSAVTAADSALRAQPGYVIDSILPPEQALRRFRAGLDTPKVLDGLRTRDELINRFMDAVRRGDRSGLQRLAIARAEFAFLIYPELAISRPPYRQPPEIAWLLLEASNGGAIEKLATKAALRFKLIRYECSRAAEAQGVLRLYSGCTVRVQEDGVERGVRLFGRIVERDGRWKFLGLEGDL